MGFLFFAACGFSQLFHLCDHYLRTATRGRAMPLPVVVTQRQTRFLCAVMTPSFSLGKKKNRAWCQTEYNALKERFVGRRSVSRWWDFFNSDYSVQSPCFSKSKSKSCSLPGESHTYDTDSWIGTTNMSPDLKHLYSFGVCVCVCAFIFFFCRLSFSLTSLKSNDG